MEPDDLLRVAMYESPSEARFVLAALQENGVGAKLSGDEVSALGLALDGPDEIEVIVRRDEFEKAKEIIEDLESGEVVAVPAWICECGEEVDEGFSVCWSCGAEYKAP